LVETMLLGRWRLRRTRDFSLAKAVQSLASHRLYPMLGSASSRAIRYPVGGAPAMLSQLHDELRAHGARFVHAEAEALRFLTEGGVHISLANGDELYARTLVVSESGAVHKVQSAGGTRTYPAETRSHEVLILRVRGVENRQLSYIELPFDPVVERVTDVTAYCQGTVSEGCRILVCESPRSAGPKATSLNPEAILQRLKDLDLLPAEVAIVEHATRQLELRRRNRAFIEHLRDLQCDSIVVVPSHGDLALSIHRNMRRWQNLGKRRPSQVVATDRGTRPMKTELNT